MYRRWWVVWIGIVILCLTLVACNTEAEVVPTASPAPTSTSPPPQRGDPYETPIPDFVDESSLIAIRQRRELRVGVLYNYPPFCFLSESGQVQGYEVALARRITELWGIDVRFVQVTRQTRLPMLIESEVDLLAAAMPHHRELEQFVEFSDTTFRSGYVVLVRSGSGIDGVDALAGRPVGVLGEEAQAAFAEYTARLGISSSVQPFETVEAAIAALTDTQSPAVEAVVGRREDMMLAARSTGGLDILNEFVAVEPYAFAVRRGDTALRDLVNLTLQQIAINGELGELFSQNFYGYAADVFPTFPGESPYSFENFPAPPPAAESVLERIRQGGPLRVAGMDLTAEPALFDSQPIIDGYNRAVLNEMARRWNIMIIESPQSVGQIGLSLLQSGQVDLVVGVRPDLSLIGQVALSQPYYQRGLRLIHMRDVTIRGISDLEFKPSIATHPLDVSEDLIKDNNGFPRVTLSESYEEAFNALVSRGGYAVVGDEYALVLMSRADERIQVDPNLYRLAPFVMALPPNDPDFAALVNFTLQDMKADGTLDLLRQQYFGSYLPEGEELRELTIELWPGDGSYLGVGG